MGWVRRSVSRLAVACATTVAVTACFGGADNAALEALREDPLASARIGGTTDERRTESAGNSGVGLPSPSVVRRTFATTSDDVTAVLDAMAQAARDAGWSVEPRAPLGYRGEKRVGSFDADLLVTAVVAERTAWMELSIRGS